MAYQEVSKRVLLVDDEESIRVVIAMLLSSLGVTVVTARDATQALELYRSDTFDLVLTDYRMPGINGDQLARTIKASNRAQRIFMITGCAEAFLEPNARPWFLDGIISKPCSLDDLIDALNGLSPSIDEDKVAA